MNPREYEEVYGYGLLDDLHNLFPEFLYDADLFPHDTNRMLGWMRHRMTNIFPQTYRRARVVYTTRHAPRRRSDYDDWQFISRISLRAPAQMRMSELPLLNRIVEPAAEDYGFSTNLFNNLMNSTTLNNLPSLSYRYQINTIPLATNQTTNPTVNPNLTTFLNSFFESVPVNASEEEINAASSIVDVSGDVICPVCQDNSAPSSPNSTPQPAWRKLNACGHTFHRNCVDRWFARNVHCPVCRADIRDSVRVDNDNRARAEAVAERVLSEMDDAI